MKESKSLLLQIGIGQPFADMLAASSPVHTAYCEKHGFDYLAITEVVYDVAPMWQRFLHMRSAYRPGGYDHVVYLDADTLIVDVTVDLRLACTRPLGMIFGQVPGGEPEHFNCGVMYSHRSPVLYKLLDEMCDAAPPAGTSESGPWWQRTTSEQMTLNMFLKHPEYAAIASPVAHVWNASVGALGAYVVGWHGMPSAEQRLLEMRALAGGLT